MLKFTNLLLLLRDVPAAVKFYGPEGLGMKVNGAASSWAVLEAEGLRISLQQAEGFLLFPSQFHLWCQRSFFFLLHSEAAVTTGYTPFVNFTVDDLDSTMMRLVLQGASLDGPVKYPLHGKVGFFGCLFSRLERKKKENQWSLHFRWHH